MGAGCTKVMVDKIVEITNLWTLKTYRIDSEMDGLKTSLIEVCLGFELFFTIQKVHSCTVIELYGTTESSFNLISAELELFWKAFCIPEPKCEIKQQVPLPADLLFDYDNPGWVKETVKAKATLSFNPGNETVQTVEATTRTCSSGKLKKCCQQVKASSPKAVNVKISKTLNATGTVGVGSGAAVSFELGAGKSITTEKTYSGRHSVTDYSFIWKVESLDGNKYTCHFKNISNVKEFVEHVANSMEKPELKYSVTAVFVNGTPIITISQLETFLMENRDKNEFIMAKVQVFNKEVDKNIKSLWLSPGSI